MKTSTPPQAIIAVDIGTGSSRALVVDLQLQIQSIDQKTYGLISPRSGWLEQDPNAVLQATLEVIQQSAAKAKMAGYSIAGLCFSSAVSSLIALDAAGRPLGNALTWGDTRAQAQAADLRENAPILYGQTGTPIHASYWLPKLCWFQKHQPEITEKAHQWMGIKDYVVRRLTGETITDCSNAAATGMLNLQTVHWDDRACSLANIPVERLLPVRPTTFIIPQIKPDAAAGLGLPQKTPVVLGAGDGVLANLGSGAISPGQAATTIGSSGACRSIASRPVLQDDRMRVWSYPLLDNLWVIGGAENSGGLVVDWFQKQIYPSSGDSFTAMMQAAESAPAGCGGLIFLPYLFGERAPIWDVTARGAWIGLEDRHTSAHLARAVLEGTVYALYDVYLALCENISPVTEIRVSGGYTRSPFWLAVQASMFAKELVVLENHECSAIGAGLLGLYALGLYPDLYTGASNLKIKETIQPDLAQAEQYKKIIPLYITAYQQLRPVFEEMQKFRLESVT